MDFLNFFRLKGITGTQEICIKIYMSLCSFKSIVPLCLVHLLKNNTEQGIVHGMCALIHPADYLIFIRNTGCAVQY